MGELARLGCVDVIDLKGRYRNATVAMDAEPGLYRRVIEGLPEAWIEDPALEPATRALLEPHRERITWDEPIHSVADIEGLPWRPRMLNLKPARFGSVRALFDTYDHCAAHGIGAYGGGMFEQGPAAGSSSTWPRCSTRTPRTTSRPWATTSRRRRTTCRARRWRPSRTRPASAGGPTTAAAASVNRNPAAV